MTPPPSGKRHSCRFLRAALVAAILALGEAALSPLHADTYQFIVSGYPAANKSYAAASSGTPIEARYRTWDESDGIALRSDKRWGFSIFVR